MSRAWGQLASGRAGMAGGVPRELGRDDDIRHAHEQALAWVELGDDPARYLLAGPDSASNLLELVVLLLPGATGAGDPRYEAASQHGGQTLRRCYMTAHKTYGHTGDGTPTLTTCSSTGWPMRLSGALRPNNSRASRGAEVGLRWGTWSRPWDRSVSTLSCGSRPPPGRRARA